MPDYRDNQCDESLLNAIRTICVFVSYVKRAGFYRTFISKSFVSGNNSNDLVVGRVSAVVVDEGGHTKAFIANTPLQSRTRLATLSGVKCSTTSHCELRSTFPNLRVTRKCPL